MIARPVAATGTLGAVVAVAVGATRAAQTSRARLARGTIAYNAENATAADTKNALDAAVKVDYDSGKWLLLSGSLLSIWKLCSNAMETGEPQPTETFT